MIHQKRNRSLTEWDPPAPSTVYIKIKNIPYETFKTKLNQGLVTTELDQIRHRLEKHIYCCGVCSKYVNGNCMLSNRKAEREWICKSFVPKEEFINLDKGPDTGTENTSSYRYLSESGLQTDFKIHCEKANDEDNEDKEAGSLKNAGLEDLYEAGAVLYRQGKLRLALEAFDEVLAENPQHFAALFQKGNSLLKLKRYEEALETFRAAARINPRHAGLWTNMGSTLLRLERLREALEAFERSISLNPVQKNAWEGKEVAISLISQFEEKIKELEAASDKSPADANTLFEKGKLYLKLGELEQAREDFEKGLSLNSESAEAWQLRGKILLELGLEKEALQALEKATRQKPDFPDAWHEKGRVFLKLGNRQSAENAFKIEARLRENSGLKKKRK